MNKHQIIRFSAIGFFIAMVIGVIFSGSSFINQSLYSDQHNYTSVYFSDDFTEEGLDVFEQIDYKTDLHSELEKEFRELNVMTISLNEIKLPEINKVKMEHCIQTIPSGLMQIQIK